MDFKRLTHCIALAEEGQFARAAARSHLSQAAFSRSIQTLEDQLGLRLFDRGSRGVQLTPAGEVVLRRARELVFDSQCLQRDIRLVRQGDVGEITIGAAPIPAAVLVPDLLCEIRRVSPQLVVRVRMGSLPTLLEQMDAQEIDFCLGDPRLVPRSSRRQMAAVGKQMGGLYGRRGHPLLRSKVDSNALRQYGLALISISQPMLDRLASEFGFASAQELPIVVQCDDITTLSHLVAQTDVLGVLPQAIAKCHPKALQALPFEPARAAYADVYAIWLKGRTPSPAAQRAVAMVQRMGAVT